MNDAFYQASQTPIPSADMLAPGHSPELDSLRQEVAALRQWKEEATRFLQTRQFDNNDNNYYQHQPTGSGDLSQLLQNPRAFADYVADQASQQLQAQMEIEHLLNEFRSRHTDLKPFETSILLEAQQIYQNSARQGALLSERDAIEKAIEFFRGRLSIFNGVNLNENDSSDTGASAKALQHLALKLDTGSAADLKKLSGDDIFHMPQDKFEQFQTSLRMKQSRPFNY